MATETRIERFGGRQCRERPDGGFAAVRRNVITTGAVTSLASGGCRSLFARSYRLEVRVFIKVQPDVGVTCLASLAADELSGFRRDRTRRKKQRYNQQRRPSQSHACPMLGRAGKRGCNEDVKVLSANAECGEL